MSKVSLQHVAIIPDGNNRWARKNSVSYMDAYAEGVNTIEKIVIRASEIGISYVTTYLMSLENFENRSKSWLSSFFSFAQNTIDNFVKENKFKDVKITTIGDLSVLPKKLRESIEKLKEMTLNNKGVVLILAIAYTGRNEIVRAINKLLENNNDINKAIDNKCFEQYLDTSNIPEPELMIRTGNEKRLSGFLLWQLAYTELIFIDELWPDFSVEQFDLAIEEFKNRKRNFGKERY